jgi:hypothetical protein
VSNPDATLRKSLHFLVAQLAAVRKPCARPEPSCRLQKIDRPAAKMPNCLFSLVRARMQVGVEAAPMSSGELGHARHEMGFFVCNACRAERDASHRSRACVVMLATEVVHLIQNILFASYQSVHVPTDRSRKLPLQIALQCGCGTDDEMQSQPHVTCRRKFLH